MEPASELEGAVRSAGEPELTGRDAEPPSSGRAATDFTHDPQRVEERREARRRGGKASAKVVRIRRLAPPALLDVY
ncbi:MAG: hypothetical protein ACRDXD_04740, partial [Acidimicrobiia bacterium]